MVSDELKAISAILDSTIKDTQEWEKRGCHAYGDYAERTGGTKFGIKNSIAIIRRLLLQASKEVDRQ